MICVGGYDDKPGASDICGHVEDPTFGTSPSRNRIGEYKEYRDGKKS